MLLYQGDYCYQYYDITEGENPEDSDWVWGTDEIGFEWILLSLIQAIEARGWFFDISYRKAGFEVKVTIREMPLMQTATI